eukprot:Phypoly_transcript_05684.p1 GENE.Phypoly_transcript_05684~~Phypoly_transcript_05684.p1  ORF type:complete len:602 (+),score=70.93 Phypoly_transcript_05684:272-1807(+)
MALFAFPLPSFCQENDSSPGCLPCGTGYYTLDTTLGRVCQTCAAGTANTKPISATCAPCMPGSYQNQIMQTACIPCYAGFYGNSSGSASIAECMPCPTGTYGNASGATTCHACPSGEFCPLASVIAIATPELSNAINSSEATFQQEDYDRYTKLDYKYLWIIAGFIFLWVLLSVIFLCCSKVLPRTFRVLRRADFFNKTNYEIPGPVMQARTFVGGFMSLGATLVIISLIVYIGVTYKYNNDMITVSLVSGLSRSSDIITNHLEIDTQLLGYSGDCEAAGNVSGCAAGITIKQDGFSAIGDVTCTRVDDATCRILWVSDSANSVFSPSTVSLQIFTNPASAYAIFWNISANSVYDGRYTYVTGYVLPSSPDNVFRGQRNDTPSLVQISIIPTTFTLWRKHAMDREGLTLNFLSRGVGHQVSSNSFYSGATDEGFIVSYEFQIPQFTYQKIVTQKQTPIIAVSNFLALVGGVMAICRILLGLYFTAKSTSGRLRRNTPSEMELSKSHSGTTL